MIVQYALWCIWHSHYRESFYYGRYHAYARDNEVPKCLQELQKKWSVIERVVITRVEWW
jgi:hypothetical protein